MSDRFQVGKKVLRYMGVAGGFWGGHISSRDGDKVSVTFNGNGLTMPFDIDEHLFLAPETPEEGAALAEKIRIISERDAAAVADLDKPQWPVGFFGPEAEKLRGSR